MSDLQLIEAAKTGDCALAQSLIQLGADVNQQDQLGWAPLNFAAGRGDLALVKLLVEAGADIFKTGTDLRTPYTIALAAGRRPVAAYLAEVEKTYPGEKPTRPERKYCKAYYLEDLRKYPSWRESRINWKISGDGRSVSESFPDDKIVFIHQDFTVTESMWQNENVIFNQGDHSWKEFCANTLKFKAPDDLDLIVESANGR